MRHVRFVIEHRRARHVFIPYFIIKIHVLRIFRKIIEVFFYFAVLFKRKRKRRKPYISFFPVILVQIRRRIRGNFKQTHCFSPFFLLCTEKYPAKGICHNKTLQIDYIIHFRRCQYFHPRFPRYFFHPAGASRIAAYAERRSFSCALFNYSIFFPL